MCWLSPTPSACLRCRTLIGTCLLYGFVRADFAVLCCVVLTVLKYSSRCSTTCSYMVKLKDHKSKKLENNTLLNTVANGNVMLQSFVSKLFKK